MLSLLIASSSSLTFSFFFLPSVLLFVFFFPSPPVCPCPSQVIDLDLFNTSWDEIRRELLIMSNLNHPNVVRLKTSFVDGQDLWIVMSLMTGGSCTHVLKEMRWDTGMKDEVMVATILKEVLQALAYFHKHGSIHR